MYVGYVCVYSIVSTDVIFMKFKIFQYVIVEIFCTELQPDGMINV